MNNEQKQNLIFRRQWCIKKKPPNAKIEWLSLPLSCGFSLFFHRDLRVYSLVDNGLGVVLLGLAFNPETPHKDPLQELFEAAKHSGITKVLTNLGGTYAVIHFSKTELKIFTDPSGMMGVYFSENGAATSPILLGPLSKDEQVSNDFPFHLGNDWYTGMITPYFGIKKLIPNCFIDLLKGKVSRFWPNSDLFERNYKEPKEILATLVELLKGMMTGVLSRGTVLCSITGGQDSRVNLAASKNNWSEISFFTLRGGPVKQEDIKIASILSKTTGITHNFYDVTATPLWLDILYNEIGADESIGARRDIAGTCLQLEGKNIIHVNGNLGALCKSYYWHNNAPKTFKVSSLVANFSKPGESTLNGIREWLDTLPPLDPSVLYNLFYLEQRGGRWISAGENCSRLFYESFTPFNSRQIFALINALPHELQSSGQLLKILTHQLAPELSTVPYCRFRRNWSKYIPEKLKSHIRNLLKAKR
jgi:hypothetical protein